MLFFEMTDAVVSFAMALPLWNCQFLGISIGWQQSLLSGLKAHRHQSPGLQSPSSGTGDFGTKRSLLFPLLYCKVAMAILPRADH